MNRSMAGICKLCGGGWCLWSENSLVKIFASHLTPFDMFLTLLRYIFDTVEVGPYCYINDIGRAFYPIMMYMLLSSDTLLIQLWHISDTVLAVF